MSTLKIEESHHIRISQFNKKPQAFRPIRSKASLFLKLNRRLWNISDVVPADPASRNNSRDREDNDHSSEAESIDNEMESDSSESE